jgi:AraC family ethanolamine operon transcriptional activator
MPAFSWIPPTWDIKNFQMRNPEAAALEQGTEGLESDEVLSRRFRDFDELSAAAVSWDFDFVQLDAGPAPSVLTQVSAPGLLVQRFGFGRSYLQRGSSPPTMRTFGFAEADAHGERMFGRDLTASDLAVFRAGGEFDAVSQPGFACLAVSIDAARFDEAFAAVGAPRGGPFVESALLRVDPKILRGLRRRVARLIDQLEANPGALGQPELSEELTSQLSIDLVLAIQSADAPQAPGSSRVRDLALRRAVSIIADQDDEPITIRQLCQETEVGWTTLVHAFREQFGVTPKAYLGAVRLNRARRGLLEAAPDSKVADVANRYGFWHMGQFAADYKRLYCELPSETRSRMLLKSEVS